MTEGERERIGVGRNLWGVFQPGFEFVEAEVLHRCEEDESVADIGVETECVLEGAEERTVSTV